jgi:hypothetical protein
LSGPAPEGDYGTDGASCSGGCSRTVNQSAYSITAFRNWCTGGYTGSTTTTRPTCSVEGVAQEYRGIAPGGSTPSNVDWDGFQVDAGWCYQVWWNSYIYGPSRVWYNRSGTSTLYVKVGNDATAYVEEQKYGSCP